MFIYTFGFTKRSLPVMFAERSSGSWSLSLNLKEVPTYTDSWPSFDRSTGFLDRIDDRYWQIVQEIWCFLSHALMRCILSPGLFPCLYRNLQDLLATSPSSSLQKEAFGRICDVFLRLMWLSVIYSYKRWIGERTNEAVGFCDHLIFENSMI